MYANLHPHVPLVYAVEYKALDIKETFNEYCSFDIISCISFVTRPHDIQVQISSK